MNTAITIQKILEEKKVFNITVKEEERYTTISVKPKNKPFNDLKSEQNTNNFSHS